MKHIRFALILDQVLNFSLGILKKKCEIFIHPFIYAPLYYNTCNLIYFMKYIISICAIFDIIAHNQW